ncbi:hypothetical protein O3G_MSEX015359 [Manduca sexta]|uniref:Bromo domain-containing protein n=1 Tax=Manduca sexta TaxID=7130 RepID=A0A922D5G7_MANSE|nr:hypothetical protein O3G_MSEX015359 [Manduca sexta]
MDLSTIRRNIDSGVVRTTAEFQRDVLLMLSNALMYNSSEHSVYNMAKEMHEEVSYVHCIYSIILTLHY